MPKSSEARRAIRVWLAEHNKTQRWLASECRVDDSMLSKVLGGYRPPTDELADKIQRKTGIDLREYMQASA